MKVLMLASGSTIHSKRVLNWLLENGCSVVFMDYKNPAPKLARNRDRFRYLPYPYTGVSFYRNLLGSRISSQLSFWIVALPLRMVWRYIKPDVVHLHQVDDRAYHCARVGLKPLILTVWGSDVNQHFLPGADPHRRRMASQALSAADLIMVDAPDMAEKCALLAGREVRMELLPLGVNTKAFRPGYDEAAAEWRRRLAIPSDAAVLLSIRAWKPIYNHHSILEAFSQARLRLKRNSLLVFKTYELTRYPDLQRYEIGLRKRVQELGLADSVRWLGEVAFEQMPEIYALADIILNYPTMDAFPVTFLEAAACERPVITCRLPSYEGSFAESFFHMVEPDKVAALADAIVEVVNEPPDQRTALLVEARRVVQQEYDEAISAERLLKLYRELA